MEPLSAISVFLGSVSSFLLLSMRVFPGRWARMFADAGRERGRPKWAWLTMTGSLSGIILFWYLHFIEPRSLSLAMAVLATFVLGRTLQSLWVKKGLREGVQMFLRGKVAATFLPYTIAGMALIVLGLL
ncbi:MAG TPA: hypothetical protein VMW85_05400 [Methanomassiliicoccales archaeon]|nr:hypothetical protein [Methanomassiliicoccales archaeon]